MSDEEEIPQKSNKSTYFLYFLILFLIVFIFLFRKEFDKFEKNLKKIKMEAIDLLAGYAIFAVFLFVVGALYNILKTIWHRATMKREMCPRNATFYPVKRMSYWEAFKRVNYDSYMRFWARANPPTFMAHLLYHTAVGTAVLTYALSFITLLISGKIFTLSISEILVYVFDWFEKFELEGYALLGSAIFTKVLMYLFMIAVVLGIIAELTTMTLSAMRKRGMIFPIDLPTKLLGTKTDGLPRKTLGGYQRKIIGLMVLGIVVPLFLQFVGILDPHIAFCIHTTIALTFIAIFPYTMLWHEVARWRMWAGVRRAVDRRTA
ncbi:MAG: hypothetical protein ACK4YO_00035 [Candidatus Altarchaeaceae archaeon]